MGSTDNPHRAAGAKTVCLTGTFHSANRGDASIQLAAALEIRRRWPGVRVVLMSSSPADDADAYPGIEVARSWRRVPGRAVAQVAAAVAGKREADDEMALISGATVVADLSGDGFTSSFGWRCSAAHSVPLLLARLLGVPCVLLGQTIGPLPWPRPYYRRLFGGTAGIAVRDAESGRELEKLGVRGTLVTLTADLAFLLPPAEPAALAAACPWAAEFMASRPVIGVTPSNLNNVRTGAGRERVLDLLAAAATRLATLSGGRILVVPTVVGPGEAYDDRRAAHALAERIGGGASVRVVEETPGPRELKALIGQCSAYAGVRMHGLIAALSQGVPSIGFGYAAKSANLFQRAGLGRHHIDARDSQTPDAEAAADLLWQARDTVRAQIAQALGSDLLPAAARNFGLLEQYLGPACPQPPA
jgi:polysaccharide pyruvyl transferase WcaK-like protein